MQIIREVHTVKDGAISVAVPENLWNTEVEVIILPTIPTVADKDIRKVKGSLSHYAKPELIKKEKSAWAQAAAEKHRAD